MLDGINVLSQLGSDHVSYAHAWWQSPPPCINHVSSHSIIVARCSILQSAGY